MASMAPGFLLNPAIFSTRAMDLHVHRLASASIRQGKGPRRSPVTGPGHPDALCPRAPSDLLPLCQASPAGHRSRGPSSSARSPASASSLLQRRTSSAVLLTASPDPPPTSSTGYAMLPVLRPSPYRCTAVGQASPLLRLNREENASASVRSGRPRVDRARCHNDRAWASSSLAPAQSFLQQVRPSTKAQSQLPSPSRPSSARACRPNLAGADESVQMTQANSRRSSMKILSFVLFCSS
ncbi:uncharacterized protein [Triticum aestivum]|uniref:uncharacterized protein n=1 Tax=Triticum aestivum TaxID=4565 RepID=UPI001D0316F6|nr:uncharacterized protein LOC123058016 [Triticum aestivum]